MCVCMYREFAGRVLFADGTQCCWPCELLHSIALLTSNGNVYSLGINYFPRWESSAGGGTFTACRRPFHFPACHCHMRLYFSLTWFYFYLIELFIFTELRMFIFLKKKKFLYDVDISKNYFICSILWFLYRTVSFHLSLIRNVLFKNRLLFKNNSFSCMHSVVSSRVK